MTQKTQLTPLSLPGQVRTFVAKTPKVEKLCCLVSLSPLLIADAGKVKDANITETEFFAVMKTNCIGFWKMNDNLPTTVVVDDSGKGHDGVAVRNTNLMHIEGKFDGAFNCVSDDLITVDDDPDQDTLGELTICSWIYKEITLIEAYVLLHDTSDSKYYVSLPYYGVRFRVKTTSGAALAYFPDSITDAWHFIVAVYNRDDAETKRLRIYVDNVLVADAAGYDEDILEGDEGLQLGKNFSGSDLDATFIFNKALTEEEIDWLWNDGDGREKLCDVIPLTCDVDNQSKLISDTESQTKMLSSVRGQSKFDAKVAVLGCS